MHNIKTNFDKILGVVKDILVAEINPQGNYPRRGTVPRFSDIEVIALSLTAECLSIDSENYLFSKLNAEYGQAFTNLISRRQYNDRRKWLFEKKEQVRKLMAARLNGQSDVFAIDSMPCNVHGAFYNKGTKIRTIFNWFGNCTAIRRIKNFAAIRMSLTTDINEKPDFLWNLKHKIRMILYCCLLLSPGVTSKSMCKDRDFGIFEVQG